MLIDSHAHLDDERFAADLKETLERARRAGVGHIVTIGTSLISSEWAISLASARRGLISATVGIHPHDADDVTEKDLVRLEELARESGVVAVGETGLDYHYDNASPEGQKRLFRRHIELSLKIGLPLVIHCREAFADCLAILNEYRGAALRAVAHCFSGGASDAEAFLRLGFLISFAGPLTFPSTGKLRDVAKTVPLESVLIETDCPYLAPQPQRGKRNEPAYVTHVAATLAELHGATPKKIAEITSSNAARLFKLASVPS